MIDASKKYLNQREDDNPHLGNFVHWFIKQKDIKKVAVAQHLGISHKNLSRYFGQPSLQFSILWRISKAINYNMVMDLGQRLNIPFETETEKGLRTQLGEKDELIKKMEIQLEVLREVRK